MKDYICKICGEKFSENRLRAGHFARIHYKGIKLSEEHKQKLSKAAKKREANPTIKKLRCIQSALNWTNPEYRNKILSAHIGAKRNEETKRKISEKAKGRLHSKETKYKLSILSKGRLHTEEAKQKMSNAQLKLNRYGEKSPSWKGGLSFEPYPIYFNGRLKKSIRERDNYTCRLCGIYIGLITNYKHKLNIHHIDYNKQNCNTNNLISLCSKCHSKTNTNREYWFNFFLQNNDFYTILDK